MRILMVSSAYWPYPAGISEAVYYLAKTLVKRGHSIKVLTTNYPHKWEEPDNCNLDVVRYGRAILIPLNKSAATSPFGFDIPYRTKQLLNSEKFDLIHLHGVYPPEIADINIADIAIITIKLSVLIKISLTFNYR